MSTVGSFVRSAYQSFINLGGTGEALLVRDRLEISYVPRPIVVHGSADLKGWIRFMEHTGSTDVDATIRAITPKNLYGYIRMWYVKYMYATIGARHVSSLDGQISPVLPSSIDGVIVPYTVKSLNASIGLVPPVDLGAFIRMARASYEDLVGSITATGGWANLDGTITSYHTKLFQGLIQSWDTSYVDAYINLLSAGTPVDLLGVLSTRQVKGFRAILRARLAEYLGSSFIAYIRTNRQSSSIVNAFIMTVHPTVKQLQGAINSVVPVELDASIELHYPEPLYGYISVLTPKKSWDRIELLYGPAKDLLGIITATGGFLPLRGHIRLIRKDIADFLAQIQCYDTAVFDATIDLNYFVDLEAALNIKSIKDSAKYLSAKIKAIFSTPLQATISTNDSEKKLLADIHASGASKRLLALLIVDKTIYSDVIAVNTSPFSDLGGVIFMTSSCFFSSGFTELRSFIRTMTPSKATVSDVLVPLTQNSPDSFSNAYPGSLATGGTYTGLDAIRYDIRIDTEEGTTIGSGVRFYVTSTNNQDNSSYLSIDAANTIYPVGSRGVTVSFSSDTVQFGPTDTWGIEVSAPPGLLQGYIAFRPFQEFLSATISYAESWQDVSSFDASISLKGGFSSLDAFIEMNSRILTGTIVPSIPGAANLDAVVGIKEWNVYMQGVIAVKVMLPRVLPYTDSFQYVTSTLPRVIKDVRVLFSKKGEQYIYSELLNNTYLVQGGLWGVELSLISEETKAEAATFGSRKKIKKKILFDISDFDSFDEAMRYFAGFIAYGATSSFNASIVPSGGFSPLKGYLTIQDIDKLKDFRAKLSIVDLSKVTAQGIINSVGAFSPFRSSIVAVGADNSSLPASIHPTIHGNLQATITIS
jgi:hypothetical protein